MLIFIDDILSMVLAGRGELGADYTASTELPIIYKKI